MITKVTHCQVQCTFMHVHVHVCIYDTVAVQDVLDESKGFVLDDQVSLQAIVEAEAPHGIQ